MPRQTNSAFVGLLGLAITALVACWPTSVSAAGENGPCVILDTSGFWRLYYTHKAPVIRTAEGLKPGEQQKARWVNRDTTPPPAGWMAPDFDDLSWRRLPGAPFRAQEPSWLKLEDIDFGFTGNDESSPYLAHLAMRGKFNVADPARVGELTLSVGYRGGVVVYLNGKELARGSFAAGAKDSPDELAEDYTVEAFARPDGTALTGKDAKDNRDRCALHNRALGDVKIPASHLRKGVNILALSIHRSAYNEVVLKQQTEKTGFTLHWSTCGLTAVRLSAADGSGLEPNVARPKGLQIWNSDPFSADFDLDWGDPNEPLRPIRLVGARGGSFSGKVAVGSTEPMKGLSAAMSDLAGSGGAKVPSAAVQVRYAMADRKERWTFARYPAAVTTFDGLDDVPPAEVPVRMSKSGRGNWVLPGQPAFVCGAVQPVWVTANVPADAKAGDYKGTLKISAGGRTFDVPVELSVSACRLPEPKDFRTFTEVVNSPETVAMKYGVGFWSEKHFQLLARTLRLLGQIGSRTTYLHLVCKTNQGNDETMVRWLPQADGSYKHDFTVLEKYIDTVIANQGAPRVVCLYIWDYHCNGDSIPVSGVGADGKVAAIDLPGYGDPRSPALWKPVLDGVRERLRKRGLEGAMMLGAASDTGPNDGVLGLWKGLAPGVPWVIHSHGSAGGALSKAVTLGYRADVWGGVRFGQDPDDARFYGWKTAPENFVHFTRDIRDYYPVSTFRFLGEMNIMGTTRGFGRQGADFWPVIKDAKGNVTADLGQRYNSWRNLDIRVSVLAPGAQGPVSTHRFEMMREGVQECEARILIEQAITDKKLPADVAARMQTMLDERQRAILRGANALTISGSWTQYPTTDHGWWYTPGQAGFQWYIASGWQERSKALFDAAAEVQAKFGK